MLNRPIEQVASEDLDALITDQVPEGRTLDYKRELPGSDDASKKEFLADVSSFANASGGDLLFGITEAGGVPTTVSGLTAPDLDAALRRLDSIIAAGLDPRISYRARWIEHASGAKVVLVRIQESWLAPHLVVFKGEDRFYSRNSAGKYPLDVSELRDAFLRNATVAERIRTFRTERLVDIAADRTPMPVKSGAKLLLHLLPLESFSAPQQLDVLRYYDATHLMEPMSTRGANRRITVDGVLTYSSFEGPSGSYTHLFRTGLMEALDAEVLNHTYEGRHQIPSTSFEDRCLNYTAKYLAILQDLGVHPPVYVFITLLGAKGRWLATRKGFDDPIERYPIGQEVVMLPEVVVYDYSVPIQPALRPSLDVVWNACGYPRSPNFAADGSWAPQRS